MTTLDEMINETNLYVAELHTFNIGEIIKEMVNRYGLTKDVYVFPYPGEVPIHDRMTAFDYITVTTFDGELFADLWQPNKKFRYNIGIFSIPMQGEQSHYMSIVIDNKERTVYFWDSMAKGEDEDHVMSSLLGSMYNNYHIKILNVCSGCGAYQSSDQYYEQNIFCHTWSLWFIDQVLSSLSQGIKLSDTWNKLQSSCGDQIYNLAIIKRFARKLAMEYFDDYKPGRAMQYVWDYGNNMPQNIVTLLGED